MKKFLLTAYCISALPSFAQQPLTYPFETGKELIPGQTVNKKAVLRLAPRVVKIIENY